MDIVAESRCFDGRQIRVRHAAESLGCAMHVSVFLPPDVARPPVLYWLSGLTCTDENFTQKAGAQRYAAEHGIAVVAPDTSPRGADVADDEAWDLGQGAGFYVNATQAPWASHYQMYDYIVDELPASVAEAFPVDASRASISGHSMGGHGALLVALRNPQRFRSVSAFAPIVAPARCPWGRKALAAYLGDNVADWQDWDACELLAGGARGPWPLLIDQGTADEFLVEQLKPELLEAACAEARQSLLLNRRSGYDHSYHFIASFIGEHVRFHAAALKA